MPESSYDCIVIGSGPGGYVAAIRAAQLGMKTAVVEKDKVGGRCLNYACIPAKAVLRAADLLSEIDEAGDFGINVDGRSVDYAKVYERRGKVISTLVGGVSGLFKKNKIDLIEGFGSVTDDGNVKVGGNFDGNVIEAKTRRARDRVAAQADPRHPVRRPHHRHRRGVGVRGAPGQDRRRRRRCVGQRDRVRVRAAGHRGAAVRGARPRAPDRGRRHLQGRRARAGQAEHRRPHGHARGERAGSDDKVTFSYGDQTGEVEWFIIAAGRGPDVEGLGLDEAGVKLADNGLIDVDGAMRTSAKNVYAIGDLVHGPALAHKASDEGVIAVENAAGLETHPIEYIDIPRATFCTPNVGSFGLTEEQAREQGMDVTVGKVQYGAVGGGTVYGDRSGMVKIIGDKKYGEMVGGHIVGSRATELIQELVNAKALEGGFPEVARIIHGHPTLSEAIMEAARAADGWLIHG